MEITPKPENKRKIPGIYWLLLTLCALATVSLLGYLAFVFFTGERVEAPRDESAGTYSREDLLEYWQDFDATLLAALIHGSDPKADQVTLAQGTGDNYFSVRTQGQLLHFDLETYRLTFPQEQEGYDRIFTYTCRVYEDVLFPAKIALSYGEHLRELGTRVILELEKDADGDGQQEYLYVLQSFGECWGGEALPQPLQGKTLCIYLDVRGSALEVHSFAGQLEHTRDVLWDNGIVHLPQENGTVTRFLLTENQLRIPDDRALLRISRRYGLLLEDRGFTRVRMVLSDVSDAPGQEILCCYHNGREYALEILSLRDGCLDLVDVLSAGEGTALYRLDNSLVFFGEGVYRRFRYDRDGYLTVVEEADDSMLSHSRLFARLQEEGSVCFDFCHRGQERLLEGSIEEDLGLKPSSQVRITGAARGKMGTVILKNQDSTLNLRTGPSTDHELLRKENGDHIRLPNGGVVTVVMPYNTDSPNNPVWVKICFDHEGQILEGYASARYIRLENANSLEPGQQLQLEAEGGQLHWESSDPSVAKIDGQTGLVTAIKPGMVCITVTNDQGSQDSCLVQVG